MSKIHAAPGTDAVSTGDHEIKRGADADVLWVSPGKISLIHADAGARQRWRPGDAVADGNWDVPAGTALTDLEAYRVVAQRFVDGVPWQETAFHRNVVDEIARGDQKARWNSRDEFAAFLERVDACDAALRQRDRASGDAIAADDLPEQVEAGIRRDGRFLLVSGLLALALARLHGVETIPVRIVCRHQEWADFRKLIDERLAKHGSTYQPIEHPDLKSIPAQHGTERAAMLRKQLQDYAGTGRRVLDIGTNWGYFCGQLEAMGFECTGIELNKKYARIATKIRDATESRYEIWQGSVLDFEGVENYDIILALNIFHHFLKTEEQFQGLQDLLKRIRAEVIFFQPHKPTEGQMRDAYRNFEADVFVEFIRSQTGMRSVTPLGKARDGRGVYMLRR